jgi:hypothetical protein
MDKEHLELLIAAINGIGYGLVYIAIAILIHSCG